jgi:hypothetical protein
LSDTSVVWAAMTSLFVTSSKIDRISIICSNRVSTHILWWLLLEVEQDWTISFLLCSSCRDVPKLLWRTTWMSIPQERISVGIEFQLLGKFLLCHVKSLMMKTSLIGSSSQVWWKMILNVYLLCHIFKTWT